MKASKINRRQLLALAAASAVGAAVPEIASGNSMKKEKMKETTVTALPNGSSPASLDFPHFPNKLYALVWRNWMLVPHKRIAQVVGAQPEDIIEIGRSMGLQGPPEITTDQQRRSYISIIRRNWHLLPYQQLLDLLGWTSEEMAFTLREDDFLFVKLGNLKPACEPIRFQRPDSEQKKKARAIARAISGEFHKGVGTTEEPLFHFVSDLSSSLKTGLKTKQGKFSPRYCYSYFALYGDPLLNKDADPYPDGYLERLANCGVDGVWLQGVLFKLASFPWDRKLSNGYKERLKNLQALVSRAARHGIGVYLYLNEPRSMPLTFFEAHPDIRGTTEGEFAALCTSTKEVQDYITNSVESICRAVPELAGMFTITASENLSNCWSHYGGGGCPRCQKRPVAEVIAEVNRLIAEGIKKSGAKSKLISWDWGWQDNWALEAISQLPKGSYFSSVSEWGIPIKRGGVETQVGEYSISTIGPGERALRHWQHAKKSGLKTVAKIQAGNTWELSAVPYIPALWNVARHIENLRKADVDGLMLGWTLGGYPSPNLEVVEEMGRSVDVLPEEAIHNIAIRRFGKKLGPLAVDAWRGFSNAFCEFPFHGGLLYNAPLQAGPANLVWERTTGYPASMVGIPYDDLTGWRAVYPEEVFISQFTKVADGFDSALAILKNKAARIQVSRRHLSALKREMGVAEAAGIHFRSVANQARFVVARRSLEAAASAHEATLLIDQLEKLLKEEIVSARALYAIQIQDSRVGFEATNHYFYVPTDLAEKVLNCRDLLDRWLPVQRAKWKS